MGHEFEDYTTYEGRNTYSRSLCFLLYRACRELYPGKRLTIRRPISKGLFCRLEGVNPTEAGILRIKEVMRSTVESGAPYVRHEVPLQDAVQLFGSLGREDVVKLLLNDGGKSDEMAVYYTLDGCADIFYGPLLPDTSRLKVWDLLPYEDGMLLRLPDRHAPQNLAPMYMQPKTMDILRENMEWNASMGLENVGDLNEACLKGAGERLVKMSRQLQNDKLVKICGEILRRTQSKDNPSVRLVLITGPSSSGKSTFCKRLALQLEKCGLEPLSVSTDDYFVDRVKTHLLPDGSYDFDNFDTVDHDAMQDDILRLLDAQVVQVPQYNFVTGIREYNGRTLQMKKGSVLIVEGIHALNPALTDKISEGCKFKIFINTFTSINLDDHNCIPTSDNRLLRRILRDHLCGAFTPCETIANWPNVRRSEVKWVYPYQETADALFNSAFLAEGAVVRTLGEKLLKTVPEGCPQFKEAARLKRYLSHFVSVSDENIQNDIMI